MENEDWPFDCQRPDFKDLAERYGYRALCNGGCYDDEECGSRLLWQEGVTRIGLPSFKEIFRGYELFEEREAIGPVLNVEPVVYDVKYAKDPKHGGPISEENEWEPIIRKESQGALNMVTALYGHLGDTATALQAAVPHLATVSDAALAQMWYRENEVQSICSEARSILKVWVNETERELFVNAKAEPAKRMDLSYRSIFPPPKVPLKEGKAWEPPQTAEEALERFFYFYAIADRLWSMFTRGFPDEQQTSELESYSRQSFTPPSVVETTKRGLSYVRSRLSPVHDDLRRLEAKRVAYADLLYRALRGLPPQEQEEAGAPPPWPEDPLRHLPEDYRRMDDEGKRMTWLMPQRKHRMLERFCEHAPNHRVALEWIDAECKRLRVPEATYSDVNTVNTTLSRLRSKRNSTG